MNRVYLIRQPSVFDPECALGTYRFRPVRSFWLVCLGWPLLWLRLIG